MAYQDYYKALNKDGLKPLNGFYGPEHYIMKSMIDRTKEKYISAGFEDMDFCEISGKNLSFVDAKNAVSTYPFMSEKRIVVIDKPDFIDSEKWGKSKIDAFFKLVNSNPAVILIMVFDDIDKRKYGAKQLNTQGSLIEFSRIDDEDLSQWLLKRFRANQKKPKKSALDYLVKQAGYNLKENPRNDLYSLEKLVDVISFSKDEEEIDLEDVAKFLVSLDEANIFEWRDALLMGQADRAIKLLHTLVRNEAPMKLSAMMQTQLRNAFSFSLLREAGYPRPKVIAKMQISEFVSRSLEALYQKYGLSGLNQLLSLSVELDERLKIGSIDGLLSFDLFSQKIASI